MSELSTHSVSWLTQQSWPDTDKKLSMMDRLFNRFDGMYPHKFRSAFANAQAIQNWREAWAEAFDLEGLMVDEIRAGLEGTRKSYDWPPSLPEFLKVCRPSIDTEKAFYEAIEQTRLRRFGKDVWSSPVIYWSSLSLGRDLQTGNYQSIGKRWAAAMDVTRLRIKSGELPNAVPRRADPLPAPGKTYTKEIADFNLAKIKSLLAESRLTAGVVE